MRTSDISSMGMVFNMGVGYNCERPVINVIKNDSGQGMIEITPDHDGHYLYLWFDEGRFPIEFDLVSDYNDDSMRRLKIIGVDEI